VPLWAIVAADAGVRIKVLPFDVSAGGGIAALGLRDIERAPADCVIFSAESSAR